MNGTKLRYLREQKGLLQKQVSLDLNISPSAIGMYEQERREADHKTLKKLANYFGVSIDFLLDNEKYENIKDANILEIKNIKQLLKFIGFIDSIDEEVTDDDIANLTKFIKQNRDFIKKLK